MCKCIMQLTVLHDCMTRCYSLLQLMLHRAEQYRWLLTIGDAVLIHISCLLAIALICLPGLLLFLPTLVSI